MLAAINHLVQSKAELFLPLICYAEIWIGIELSTTDQRWQAAREFHSLLRASGILIVSDNVEIAREAARAQAEYRRRGGQREVLIPDFLIGANAVHYSGTLLTTNPREFLKSFPRLKVLTPKALISA